MGVDFEPVSKENETQACETMIAGCKDALLQYETSIEQDEDMLSIQDISDEKLLSIRVLLGEKKRSETRCDISKPFAPLSIA